MDDWDTLEVKILRAIAGAARAYRKAEQEGTPRLWRGKDLHDLAAELDSKLEALYHFDAAANGDFS